MRGKNVKAHNTNCYVCLLNLTATFMCCLQSLICIMVVIYCYDHNIVLTLQGYHFHYLKLALQKLFFNTPDSKSLPGL